MFPILNDEQRQAINENGTPLRIVDDLTGATFMLLSVESTFDPKQSSCTACIPGIDAYGEGETEQEAALALQEALRRYINAFG